ncbi:MAG: hypothetical protein WCJ35_28295 [Planctomycetota bacterium]
MSGGALEKLSDTGKRTDQWPLSILFLSVALLVALVVVSWLTLRGRDEVLPSPSEVAEIQILGYSDCAGKTNLKPFVLPSHEIGHVMSCLRPRAPAPEAAKFLFAGAMKVRTRDGRVFFVEEQRGRESLILTTTPPTLIDGDG